ncbi:MAG: ParB/RepB/Spo0J family partition protein [Ignavibacteriaceae bacterium]|jgi:ParB family chromosome partitioning protein|nr:ParB/RepB/Spo0J family partition protein [Ignavibacteriaceae bacterium]
MKQGLGRGLDALINPQGKDNVNQPLTVVSTNIKNDDGATIDILVKIPVETIVPNEFQPRTEFNADALNELKKSILENGLIQPITVRRVNNHYELVSGERRLRACKDIGYKDIPAYVIKVDTKEAMLALSLIENIQREELNPIEIANAYRRLMDECSLTQEEIADKVGKDRSTITNSIRLLKLPAEVQSALIKEEISSGHARALINLPTSNIQVQFLDKIKKENLSVRKVEQLVREFLETKTKKFLKADQNKSHSHTPFRSFEERLQLIMGTKVFCKQKKDGKGEVVIEFYSDDEFERLLELFEIIGKNNS